MENLRGDDIAELLDCSSMQEEIKHMTNMKHDELV